MGVGVAGRVASGLDRDHGRMPRRDPAAVGVLGGGEREVAEGARRDRAIPKRIGQRHAGLRMALGVLLVADHEHDVEQP